MSLVHFIHQQQKKQESAGVAERVKPTAAARAKPVAKPAVKPAAKRSEGLTAADAETMRRIAAPDYKPTGLAKHLHLPKAGAAPAVTAAAGSTPASPLAAPEASAPDTGRAVLTVRPGEARPQVRADDDRAPFLTGYAFDRPTAGKPVQPGYAGQPSEPFVRGYKIRPRK